MSLCINSVYLNSSEFKKTKEKERVLGIEMAFDKKIVNNDVTVQGIDFNLYFQRQWT